MAYVGLKSFTVGMLDEKGQLIKDTTKGLSEQGIFEANLTTAMGATQANITGLAPSLQKIFGSNAVADNSVGVAQPQVVLGANNLPHEIGDKLVGMIIDEMGAATATSGLIPNVALIVTTQDVATKKDINIAFFGGNMVRGEANLQTNNQNEVRVNDALTFSANARVSDGAPYKIFYAENAKFDREKMLNEVFPGYAAATVPTGDGSATAPTEETGK